MKLFSGSLRNHFLLYLVCLSFFVFCVGIVYAQPPSVQKKQQEFSAKMLEGKLYKTRQYRSSKVPLYRGLPDMEEKSNAYGGGFVATESGSVEVSGICFDFGKSYLRKDAYQYIEAMAESFNTTYRNIKIVIKGYTDNIGSEEYNRALSLRRAESVVSALVSMGVNRSQLVTKGLGESYPLLPNTSEQNRSYNRRVGFSPGESY